MGEAKQRQAAAQGNIVKKHANHCSGLTPGLGKASEFREYQGLRLARQLEVAWELPEGWFTDFKDHVARSGALRGAQRDSQSLNHC